MLRLRAQITIDIEAADFVSAADHQRQVEGSIENIRQTYADTNLVLRERRELAGPREHRPEPGQRPPHRKAEQLPGALGCP